MFVDEKLKSFGAAEIFLIDTLTHHLNNIALSNEERITGNVLVRSATFFYSINAVRTLSLIFFSFGITKATYAINQASHMKNASRGVFCGC